MQITKIKAEIKNIEDKQVRTEEDEKRRNELEIILNAKMLRRPTTAAMSYDILLMIKKISDSEDPSGARKARAILSVFLRELAAHKQGKHAKVAQRILEAMKEKQPFKLWTDDLEILARAAIRYEITFGHVMMH